MRLITKQTDYAMRALRLMARNGEELYSVAKLSEQLRIPRPFLRRILQTLAETGVLTSFKGRGGGFRLELLPEKIFIGDLIRTFQGQVELGECLVRGELCTDSRDCLLRGKIKEMADRIDREFSQLSIASLAEGSVRK